MRAGSEKADRNLELISVATRCPDLFGERRYELHIRKGGCSAAMSFSIFHAKTRFPDFSAGPPLAFHFISVSLIENYEPLASCCCNLKK
jgi:hypothetical protein